MKAPRHDGSSRQRRHVSVRVSLSGSDDTEGTPRQSVAGGQQQRLLITLVRELLEPEAKKKKLYGTQSSRDPIHFGQRQGVQRTPRPCRSVHRLAKPQVCVANCQGVCATDSRAGSCVMFRK